MGGKTTSTSATKLNQISVQSSSLGKVITLGWGRGRATCNLIDYVAFTATAHTTKSGGGKGLGGGSKNTTYTYTASIILGLCEGGATGIIGIRSVYRDTSVFTNGATSALAQAGLSLANGAVDQSPWSYMVSAFSDHALAYSGIAYLYAQDYALGDTAALPNHSFEVDFRDQFSDTICDAIPAVIATDYLTNPAYGVPGWASGLIADWSDWSDYTVATGLLLSPVEESARAAKDFLTEITDASNTAIFSSEGLLKTKPLGDAVATGNAVTWTPDLTPVYDLTEDDFCPSEGDPPVTLEIVDQTDAYNQVQVEFLDRANQYNTAIQAASDLDNIITYGPRKQDPTSWHTICDAAVAQTAGQLLLQRTLYIRKRYSFRLPEDFILLEPTDLVTLTTTTDGLRLDRALVRIEEIGEDEESSDGYLNVIAREVPIGTASVAAYASHSGDGYIPNADIAPGSVSVPALFNPPPSLTSGNLELWCAAASTSPTWGGCEAWISADGVKYDLAGTIEGPARYGVLTGSLAAHADPDSANTLAVNLATSLGTLDGATDAGMNAAATLALIGGELVAYRDADLTSAYHYNLSPLRRGLYGTSTAAHSIGDTFVRLDDAVFKFAYTNLTIGSTIYVKLPSFNVYGRALQDLADVTAYSIMLDPAAIVPAPPDSGGDWTLSGATIAGDGSLIPELVFTGSDPTGNAKTVLYQYYQGETAPVDESLWLTASAPVPNGIPPNPITAVGAGLPYMGSVRLIYGIGISDRLILGPVISGEMGSTSTAPEILTDESGDILTDESDEYLTEE